MIRFVYHIKPKNLKGNILYPLNKLKEKHPEEYKFHSHKYSYRKELMEISLPGTQLLWNDVIHLCPVDIETVIREEAKVYNGFDKSEKTNSPFRKPEDFKYYKIDLSCLDEKQLYVFNTCNPSKDMNDTKQRIQANTHRWDIGKEFLSEKITQGQIDYFKKCALDPKLPKYLFTAIPHVLYAGPINLDIVEELDIDNFY